MPIRRSRVALLVKSAGFWLFVVTLAFFLAQLALFDEQRFLEWDEAVYIGEASDRIQSPGWNAHRSLGIVWILKPYMLLADSLAGLRWYLAAVSSVLVGISFSRWLRPVGFVAPTAMAVFVSGWMPLLYGTEVSPNLYVASLAVAAAGATAAFVVDHRLADLALVSVFVAAFVMLRPSDAVVITAALWIAMMLLLRSSDRLRASISVALGFAIGLTPWLVESFSRFGGPIERLRAASGMIDGGFVWNTFEHLRLQDGPLIGPDRTAEISGVVIGALTIHLVLATVGILRRHLWPNPQIAFGAAVLAAAPYLFYVAALAPRFLLPASALLSIPIAAGIHGLWARRVMLGSVAAALVLVVGAWSISTASSIHAAQMVQREEIRLVASAISDSADEKSCTVLSQYGYPQLVVATGCTGSRADLERLACQLSSLQAQQPEWGIYVALVSDPPDELADVLVPASDVALPSGWTLYVAEAGIPIRCDSD